MSQDLEKERGKKKFVIKALQVAWPAVLEYFFASESSIYRSINFDAI